MPSKVDSTKFDPEGEGYDYSTAEASGGKPDTTGHWGSLDPRTGMVLKGKSHKTWNLTVKKETELGNKIIKKADGRYYSTPDTSVKKYKKGGKADTVPAMLTPGEVVLNEKQQKALEKYIGKSREEIFGKIKVPGFNIGGKVRHKYYQEGGEVKHMRSEKELDARSRARMKKAGKTEAQINKIMDANKKFAAKRKKQMGTWVDEVKRDKELVSFKKAKEKAKRMKAAGYKLPPGLRDGGKVNKKKKYDKGGMVKKAYSRMYEAKWGR